MDEENKLSGELTRALVGERVGAQCVNVGTRAELDNAVAQLDGAADTVLLVMSGQEGKSVQRVASTIRELKKEVREAEKTLNHFIVYCENEQRIDALRAELGAGEEGVEFVSGALDKLLHCLASKRGTVFH